MSSLPISLYMDNYLPGAYNHVECLRRGDLINFPQYARNTTGGRWSMTATPIHFQLWSSLTFSKRSGMFQA